MKPFIDIVEKRIYLFNTEAWNYRKKIGFPVCKKENFAGLQAHRKRGKSARASPTPHHTLNEERSARFTAQPLSALSFRVLSYSLPSLAPTNQWERTLQKRLPNSNMDCPLTESNVAVPLVYTSSVVFVVSVDRWDSFFKPAKVPGQHPATTERNALQGLHWLLW